MARLCSTRVRGRPRRAAHPPRRLRPLRHPLEPRPRAGHRAPGEGLLGLRPARHRLRPARRPGSRRARPDLPLDGADPVEPARGRALGARGDRRRVPLAAHHDARAALQPDEAKPRRRARPRPHHHGRRSAASTAPRLEYPQVRAGLILMMDRTFDERQNAVIVEKAIRYALARHRRRRHRRPAAGRRALPVRGPGARWSRRRATAGLGVTIHVGEEGGASARGDRRGRRDAAARPDRPRHPRRARPRADAAARAPGSCSRSARRRTC